MYCGGNREGWFLPPGPRPRRRCTPPPRPSDSPPEAGSRGSPGPGRKASCPPAPPPPAPPPSPQSSPIAGRSPPPRRTAETSTSTARLWEDPSRVSTWQSQRAPPPPSGLALGRGTTRTRRCRHPCTKISCHYLVGASTPRVPPWAEVGESEGESGACPSLPPSPQGWGRAVDT